MGMIKDRKKFKTTVKQTNPTNPRANTKMETNDFDIRSEERRVGKECRSRRSRYH